MTKKYTACLNWQLTGLAFESGKFVQWAFETEEVLILPIYAVIQKQI